MQLKITAGTPVQRGAIKEAIMPVTVDPKLFTLCTTGTCPKITHTTPGNKDRERKYIGMPGDASTCKGLCKCRIFKRKMKATGTWALAAPNSNGDIENDEEYDYDSACVTAVLPAQSTLCSASGCEVNAAARPKTGEIYCPNLDTPCLAGCECNLFRLKLDSTLAWEHVAKPGKRIEPDKEYYYECMCTK